METRPHSNEPWWTVSGNFYFPLMFYMEEEQEERVFGRLDADLGRIEAHSHTLIQLEGWFTATGQTRVTVVQWWRTYDTRTHFFGLELLQRVRSQPLTEDDLAK
uniref:KH domain containing 1 like n=1 Tax=Myotis myotis TaxID=51298 RepID=A0A7J7WVA8_MYOMY|nr:KH domain containing 1 like [Myotis myotis]